VTRSQHAAALRARDDGLRRVRKITWRIGLAAAAGSAFVFARFAHLAPSLPHLPHLSGFGDSSSQTGSSQGSSGGLSSPSGVSPGTGGGQAVSGGS
jgi:hypothetical protein